jgi:hypothetical protein
MKKVLLTWLAVASMATMVACSSQEAKKSEVVSDDKDAGSFTSLDEKSAKVKQLVEAYVKNDSTVGHEIYADTLQAYGWFANNQDSLQKTKVSPGGRAEFLKGDMNTHALFSGITMSTDNIKTFTFTDGRVLSGYWGMWTATGRFTKKFTTAPVHMILVWEGDKVVKIYRMFDTVTLQAEIAASQAK